MESIVPILLDEMGPMASAIMITLTLDSHRKILEQYYLLLDRKPFYHSSMTVMTSLYYSIVILLYCPLFPSLDENNSPSNLTFQQGLIESW
mmetsp:Transcript_17637/g.43409  ORF Transcript_17637/g.43409 Transcript_17637/m.43409 type:complete len:91 (-) Transcript_17637:759-1031(-)